MKLVYLLLLLAMLAGTSCAVLPPGEAERRFADSPHVLQQPFLAAWQRAGGEELGPPLSAAVWLDSHRVQLFETVRMQAGAISGVAVEPQPAGWQQTVPPELLSLPAAAYQVDLYLPAADVALPTLLALSSQRLEISAPGYSGPLELRFYDAAMQPAGQASANIVDGSAAIDFRPRGALGPQWALAIIDGELAGAQRRLFRLEAQTRVNTGAVDLDLLYPHIYNFIQQKVVSYELNGATVRGYRSPDNPLLWLRDHVYQARGFRYFESDVTSLLEAFEQARFADGSFPDVLDYPARQVVANRKEVEADLEFLFVQGVYEAWQFTGDDDWLRARIPAMRRGLAYIMSDPLRWDAEYGLVRRPYTIDTWDFEYGPTTLSPDGKPAPRHWIDEDTTWGIFHGDNTGLAYALELTARIEEQVGDPEAAEHWRAESRGIMERLNTLSWNGSFFYHFVQSEGEERGQLPTVPGVDTGAQLSLSNAYALNREVLGYSQARKIIEEYFSRRDFARAFAEWYSIDPPFPPGSYGMAGRKGENPGEYVNGGILPLVGGELARGAFEHGGEAYGFDILSRYAELIRLTDETYLWYYPDGRPGISGPDTVASDGWGSSAMLGALMEGAAGLRDQGSRYEEIVLSPRWSARPDLQHVEVTARYAASDAYVAYIWQRSERDLQLDLTGTWQSARVRLMLPPAAGEPTTVLVNGEAYPFEYSHASGGGYYAVVEISGGNAEIVVQW